MERKLLDSTMKFNLACYDKLIKKEELGWTGWDCIGWKGDFIERIKNLLKRELNQKNLVNIANYCNFLWNLIEVKKEGGELIENNRSEEIR